MLRKPTRPVQAIAWRPDESVGIRRFQLPDVKERLLQQGAFATFTTPDEATRRIHAEIAMWAKVVADANIKPE